MIFCLKGGMDAKVFDVLLLRPLFACKFALIWLVDVIMFLWTGGDDLIGCTRTGTGFVNDAGGGDEGGEEGDCIDGISLCSIVFRFDIEVDRFCNICGCVGSKVDRQTQ